MISYSKYKLLKEADTPVPATPPSGVLGTGGGIGGGTGGAGGASGGPPMGDIGGGGGPPPGFSGGPPMGGLGGGGPSPSMDLGIGGGPPGGNSPTDLKPSSLKSSNVWDVLEDILNNSSENRN